MTKEQLMNAAIVGAAILATLYINNNFVHLNTRLGLA